ncbi:hypothetical protein ABVT39_005641 [Epinephelus coioides]
MAAASAVLQSAEKSAGLNLKNTLRFETKDKEVPDRVSFGKKVLFEALSLRPEDIFCLQQNMTSGYYDVTFNSSAQMEEVRGLVAQQASPALKPFQVTSLFRNNFRVVTVHMYNPWVSEETIRFFLGRYAVVLPGIKEIKDALGIWTGKRQFRVQLKEEATGYDGFCHPPAVFTIGGNRGYLVYAGQPKFCRKCHTYGHVAETCTQVRCRNCGELGHLIKDCLKTKRCDLCSSEHHLARDCPRPKSYAVALKDGTADRGGDPTSEDAGLRDIEVVLEEIQKQQEEQREIQVEMKSKDCNNTEMVVAAIATPTPATGEVGEAGKVDGDQLMDGWNIMTKRNRKRSKKRKVVFSPETSTQDPDLTMLPPDSSFSPLLDESEVPNDVPADVIPADEDPLHTESSSTPPPSGFPALTPSGSPTPTPSQEAPVGEPTDGGPRHFHLFPFPLPPLQPSSHNLPHVPETTTSRVPWVARGRQRRGSFGPLRPGSLADGKDSMD